MARKKILAISYLFPNSEQPFHGIFVLNRIKAMSAYADITVINPVPDSPVHGNISKLSHYKRVPEKEVINGIEVYHPRFFSIPGHLKIIESLSYYLAVKKVIANIGTDFDLIDLHWTYPDLPTGAWLANKWNTPLCVTLRGMEAFHEQDRGLRKKVVAHFLKKSDLVISLSEEMAVHANRIANTGSKTKVIRNGVDTEKFFFIEQEKCRAKLGIPLEDKVVLGVGAVIYRKGFDLVIRALPKVLQQPGLENTKFYIVGSQGAEGDYRSELKKLVRDLGLEEHVVFAGKANNNELVDWYSAADVFCLSSRGEGSPNVLTEALACGTPAIACDVGSVAEIMASEANLGHVIKSDDVTELEGALIRQLKESVDKSVLAKSFKKYTWDWCATNVMNAFSSRKIFE